MSYAPVDGRAAKAYRNMFRLNLNYLPLQENLPGFGV
jgi:hypothetical protein